MCAVDRQNKQNQGKPQEKEAIPEKRTGEIRGWYLSQRKMHNWLNKIVWRPSTGIPGWMLTYKMAHGIYIWCIPGVKNSRRNIEEIGNVLADKYRQKPDEESGNRGNGTLATCKGNTGEHECCARDDCGQSEPGPANEVRLR